MDLFHAITSWMEATMLDVSSNYWLFVFLVFLVCVGEAVFIAGLLVPSLPILLLVGGASIASVMYANVAERRKEIGTLMALGATPGYVTRMFLGKATILGVAGGGIGFVAGTALAMAIGPQLVGVSVLPLPYLCGVGIATATVIAVAASYLPARRAARLDPCLCFSD